ncbi:Photosystem II reaction center W protein, chloroplastic [Linum grandiflorum]
MASISAATTATSFVNAPLRHKPSLAISSSSVLGLPAMEKKGRLVVKCSAEGKGNNSKAMSASAIAAAATAAAVSSPAAMALVDVRMSTEGTGLPFGLSNNLLGWLLLGVFGLIWSLYTVYTSDLEEDEESGLSL